MWCVYRVFVCGSAAVHLHSPRAVYLPSAAGVPLKQFQGCVQVCNETTWGPLLVLGDLGKVMSLLWAVVSHLNNGCVDPCLTQLFWIQQLASCMAHSK